MNGSPRRKQQNMVKTGKFIKDNLIKLIVLSAKAVEWQYLHKFLYGCHFSAPSHTAINAFRLCYNAV